MLVIVVGALVTLISSLASSEFLTGYWETLFGIAAPVLAAILTAVGGFSQTFQWGATWKDMVLTAQELEKELDRFIVSKPEELDLRKEAEIVNDFVLQESRGFFERMLGSASAPKKSAAEQG
jgi:hypothetical protein